MRLKERTAGLFFPLMLFSVGIFVIVIGILPAGKPFLRQDFEGINGTLSEDANNVGPYYRTFFLEEMPNARFYVGDEYLSSAAGPRFSDIMEAGVIVKAYVPNKEINDWNVQGKGHFHVYGLIAAGETLIDIDHVVGDQENAEGRARLSFLVVGGLLLLGGVIFGMAKLKTRNPVVRG